jgi:hypothetical protein
MRVQISPRSSPVRLLLLLLHLHLHLQVVLRMLAAMFDVADALGALQVCQPP